MLYEQYNKMLNCQLSFTSILEREPFSKGLFSFLLLHYLPLLYCSIKKAKWLFFSSTFVNKETKLSSFLEKEYVDVLIHSQTFQPHINLVLNLDEDVAKTLGH